MTALARRADVSFRELERHEVDDVWSIDRTEIVEKVYRVQSDQLVLRPERHETIGWPEGERDLYAPMLVDCFERGGRFLAAFVSGELIGASILDPHFMGCERDRLQLKFLHVSQAARGAGVGTALFERTIEVARELGARRLYVSATNSENTVDFYLRQAFRLAKDIDAGLFELEPDDIHMELDLSDRHA